MSYTFIRFFISDYLISFFLRRCGELRCSYVAEGVTAGRNVRYVPAPTIHVSRRQTAETQHVRRGLVIAVQPPASNVIRTEHAVVGSSAATRNVSSSSRRRVPPCPPSTVPRILRRAAGVCSDGDPVRRVCAPVLVPNTRPNRVVQRHR